MPEDKVDRAAKDSFPASDAPANSGIVGPLMPEPAADERDEESRPKGTPTDDRHAAETAYQREDEASPRAK